MTPHNQALTVSITVNDAKAAVDYYQKAFNAEVLSTWPMPDGTIVHADMKIGDTLFYLSGEYPDWQALSPKTVGGCPNLLCLRCENFEAVFQQAVDAGAEVMHPMQDFPWGVRAGVLTDPFGYRWSVGMQVEDVSPEEVMRRMMNASQ